MQQFAKDCRSTVIPGVRYRDAVAMIEWLCRAFGFEKHAVYMEGESIVAHAQLTFGNGMVMVGSVKNEGSAAATLKQPDEIGGFETQAPYLLVADCDAIYASAKAAGARMVNDLAAMDYGGKAFSCHDPEGHLWYVGSYDPWEEEPKA